ncbi:MAG: ribosomal protein S18-alanine N-acetyltransferase [Candidatus Thiodiazotropha sp.]|nr:ribosomal protein S18-alanine N-acetyltransferase [Candidatus Thiodiazotropha sp.]MCM8882547.1 ribosomal protein S18-alanine N-acetyltransferase [Candidatus Thiodiazotropha sp.]MCM8918735.1 ribosomal protein S18-alanine N-acetyltransferase [Candidatus Thiodiazotropha sp.]
MSAQQLDPLLGIRPMQNEDLSHVMAMEERVYPFPWTLGIFQDCLRVGYCCWVVTLDQQVIGYGVMSVVIDESHILNICIHPTWQGQGLGYKLTQRLLKIARQHGAETVFLEVRASNQIAFKLYEKIGFVKIGQRKNYYPAADRKREDALVMALEF